MKKIIPLFLILLGGGIFLFFIFRERLKQVPLQTQKEIPSNLTLANFQYIGGEKDCCVCSGIASLYKYNGGLEKIFEVLEPMALNHDLSYLTKALKQFNLQSKLHLGYFYQGKTSETRQEMLKNFAENLANPQKQIHLFKNEDEVFKTLQNLISQNKPVMYNFDSGSK